MDAPADCVVFDIDGTLTPKVSAIHTARDGAATAVKTFADAGYQVIYVSARIQLFRIYTEVESHARSRAELAMSGNSLTMSVQT